MKNNDLKSLWKASEQKASDYYNTIEQQVVQKAKSASNDIISRIRKRLKIELWISIPFAFLFPFLFLGSLTTFLSIGALMMVALALTLWLYLGLLSKLKNIQEDSVLNALERKEKILSRYVWWQYVLVAIGFVLGVSVGFSMGVQESRGEFNFAEEWYKLLILLPVMGIAYWLLHKYIHAMYGKSLKELRQVLRGLKEHYENDSRRT